MEAALPLGLLPARCIGVCCSPDRLLRTQGHMAPGCNVGRQSCTPDALHFWIREARQCASRPVNAQMAVRSFFPAPRQTSQPKRLIRRLESLSLRAGLNQRSPAKKRKMVLPVFSANRFKSADVFFQFREFISSNVKRKWTFAPKF